MPDVSARGAGLPASPIRKLSPFADEAKRKGIKVYHLNIGQPDLPTPEKAMNAIRNIDSKTLAYSPSQGRTGEWWQAQHLWLEQTLLAQIDSLYNKGNYSAALDSITQLRERFPKAVEARKHALKVWQDASLKMAQDDVAKTDILLQETESQLQTETDRYRRNMLGVRRDSLKARYEAMCGVVRMIHMRQKQH